MKSFKSRTLLCALIITLTFTCFADTYAKAIENKINGDWECVVEMEDSEDFVFFLYFTEPNDVTYVAGWYQSEIAATYAGLYTIENDNVLNLEMTDTETAETLIGSFSFSVSEGVLTLTNQSGDCLAYMFEAGAPMEFHAIDNSAAGFSAQIMIDKFAWQISSDSGRLPILILAFEYLMISDDDAEALIEYGLDPDAGQDYEISMISEDWEPYTVTADTQIILYKFDDTGDFITWEGTIDELKDKLLEALDIDGYIWAKVTVSDNGELLKVEEVYKP